METDTPDVATTWFLYSAAAGGFFVPGAQKSDALPADIVLVSADEHRALMAAQAAGLSIIPGTDGRPMTTDRPTFAPELAMRFLRARRDRHLRASDHSQVPDVPMAEATRAEWLAYRQALRDLPATFADNPNDVVWPTPPEA